MDYRDRNPFRDEQHELFPFLKALPKIDLHRHLEGSLRLSTMADIASQYRLDLPSYTIEDIRRLVQMTPHDRPRADVFMTKFQTLRSFFQSPEIIDRVAYEAVADAAADNVIYLEMRFTPAALAYRMDFPLREVTGWVTEAVCRARRDYGIEVGLLVSINRHESVAVGYQTVGIAAENRSRGVAGIDLAGAENRFPGAPFAPVFWQAREAGLHTTAHAAEWDGPESAREAIETLGATRLGHGVRVVESREVVALARERGVAFEVCPTSNVQSGVVPAYEAHPLRAMAAAGLLTTINTDDPSVCGISLTDEYLNAVKYLGLTLDDLKRHVLNAARAAFLPPAGREQLVKRIETAYTFHETRPEP